MLNVDMYYNDKYTEVDRITVFFNDLDNTYWCNIYKNDKCIGDYTCNSSIELEKAFSQLCFDWN